VFYFEFQHASINVVELVEGACELLPSLSTICKLSEELSDSREPLSTKQDDCLEILTYPISIP
jgi:hypothetical protein